MVISEKLRLALENSEVQFFLIATPELKRLLTAGTHPMLSKIRRDTTQYLLEGKALVVANEDIISYVEGTMTDPRHKFLLQTGEIRVCGNASVAIPKKEQG